MAGASDSDPPYDVACLLAKNLEPIYGGLAPRRSDRALFAEGDNETARRPIALVPTPIEPFPLISYWLPDNYTVPERRFVLWTANENRLYFPLKENLWISAHALGRVKTLTGQTLTVTPIAEWHRIYQYRGYIQLVWKTGSGFDYEVWEYTQGQEGNDGFVFQLGQQIVPPGGSPSYAGASVFWVAQNTTLPAVSNLTVSEAAGEPTSTTAYMLAPQVLRRRDSNDYESEPLTATTAVINPNRNRWLAPWVWDGQYDAAINSIYGGTLWSGISILDAATPKTISGQSVTEEQVTTQLFNDPNEQGWFNNLKRNNIPLGNRTLNDWKTHFSGTLSLQHPASGERDIAHRDSWVYRAVRYPPRWRLEPSPFYDRFGQSPDGADTMRWIFGPYIGSVLNNSAQRQYRPYLAPTGDVYSLGGEAWCFNTEGSETDSSITPGENEALGFPAYGFKFRKINDEMAWLVARWVFKRNSDYALVVFRFLRPGNNTNIGQRWKMSGNNINADHSELPSRVFGGWNNETNDRNGIIITQSGQLCYSPQGDANDLAASIIDTGANGLVLTIPEIIYIGSGSSDPQTAIMIGGLKTVGENYVPAELRESDIVWGKIKQIRSEETVFIGAGASGGVGSRPRNEPAEQMLGCYRHHLKGVQVEFPPNMKICGLVFQCETRGLSGIGPDGRFQDYNGDWNTIAAYDSKPSWFHNPGKDHRQHATPYATLAIKVARVTESDPVLGSAYYRRWAIRFDFAPAGETIPLRAIVAYLERGEAPGQAAGPATIEDVDTNGLRVSFTLPAQLPLRPTDRYVIAEARGDEWIILKREELGTHTSGQIDTIVDLNRNEGRALFGDDPLPYGAVRSEAGRLIVASKSVIWISALGLGLSFTRYPTNASHGFSIPIPEYDSELVYIDGRVVVLSPQRAYTLVLDEPQNTRLIGTASALNYVRPTELQRIQPVAGTLTLTEFNISEGGKPAFFIPRWSDITDPATQPLALGLAWNGQIPYVIIERPSEYEIYFAPGNPTGWLLWTIPKTTNPNENIMDTTPRLTHYEFIDGYLVLTGNRLVKRCRANSDCNDPNNWVYFHTVLVGYEPERVNPNTPNRKVVYKTGAIYLQQGVRTKKAAIVINDMPGRTPNTNAVLFKQYPNAEATTPSSTVVVRNRETFPLLLNARKNEALMYELEWLDPYACVDRILVYPAMGARW